MRFGNGIEFWGAAHDNLVEGCRIWEIYDAALTNQGQRPNVEADQHHLPQQRDLERRVLVRVLEPDRKPPHAEHPLRAQHVLGAGMGWGHANARPQRAPPDVLRQYGTTSGIVVRDNIFAVATDSCLRIDNDWSKNLVSDGNSWFQPEGTLVSMLCRSFPATRFAEYQKWSGLDAHSVVGDPRFVNAAEHDFRLGPAAPRRFAASHRARRDHACDLKPIE